jgi:hypothetical protein
MPDWRDLEILVAKIQRQLAPDATVEHNVKLPGLRTGTPRQIDVLVRQNIGQYEMRIVIDCKDYAKPVDVNDVDAFAGLVQDIGANKAAMVSPKGFTDTAKKRAVDLCMDLFSPVDTDSHKWRVSPRIPIACDFREALISFGINTSAPKQFQIKPDFWKSNVKDRGGATLGSAYDVAVRNWNNGLYPTEPREHKRIELFNKDDSFIDNGYGEFIPVTLTVSLFIKQQLYFGYLPISDISGFRDELSGGVIANAFTTGILDLEEVTQNWVRVDSVENMPIKPVMILQGLSTWEE